MERGNWEGGIGNREGGKEKTKKDLSHFFFYFFSKIDVIPSQDPALFHTRTSKGERRRGNGNYDDVVRSWSFLHLLFSKIDVIPS